MDQDMLTLEKARSKIEAIKSECKKRLFGIDQAIENLLVGLFSAIPYSIGGKKDLGQGHVLLMAPPGFGKTDMMQAIAQTIQGKYSFFSGHPEMKISEIVGGDEYEMSSGRYFLRRGPCFAHIILYDEINRTHPKAQALWLPAMEERCIAMNIHNPETGAIENKKYRLYPVSEDENDERMFFWVVASGNPFEQEGTYTIPEAQLDRFSICFNIDLPSEENEQKIRLESVYKKYGGPVIQPVMDLETAYAIPRLIAESVRFEKSASAYMGRLIHNSRPSPNRMRYARRSFLKEIDLYVKAGLSPRSNFAFQAVARTIAFLRGRDYVAVDDVKAAAKLVMPHRLLLQPKARGRRKPYEVVEGILSNTEVPSCNS